MNTHILQNPNGFQTNVWGPGAWLFLHCIALNYNPKYYKQYHIFFKTIQHILPCKAGRDNYSHSINKNPSLMLKKSTFKNRETLSLWLFKLHTYVRCKTKAPIVYSNDKTGFRQMLRFYEQFRASCSQKVDLKPKHTGCVHSYYKGMRLRTKIQIKPFCSNKVKHSIKVQLS